MNRIFVTLQRRNDLPGHRNWLTPNERARCDAFRFEKRRLDWLLGRWTAKQARLHVEKLPEPDIGRFEVASADDGAPLPLLDGERFEIGLSLSHSNDRALCAVSRDVPTLGCDIEFVEPRSRKFVSTFFTAAERECVDNTSPELRDTLTTMIWSAKESTLKALGTGLKADTRRVEVIPGELPTGDDWNCVDVVSADDGRFGCFWRRDGQFVLTVSATISAMSRTRILSSSLATRTASSIMIMQNEQPTAIVSAPVSFA